MTERSVRRDPDALIRRAGVRGDPNRDQHFLVDDRVLERLPTYLPDGTDVSHVLEVGGGTGGLTDRLLRYVAQRTAPESGRATPDARRGTPNAGRVTVVERDPVLAAFLREEFADAVESGTLSVVEGDALDVELPGDVTACVSNLPYGVSSEITFRLLPLGVPCVLMFQREFAERMAADAGTPEYGRLSVTAGHYAEVEVVEPVPKAAFDPQPAVESAVVRTTPRPPDYEVPDDAFFMRFVTACFTQRRKTMRNAVRNTSHISGMDDPDAVVDAASSELMSKRAGEVTPAAFAELASLAWEVGEP